MLTITDKLMMNIKILKLKLESLYRLEHSDMSACNNCIQRGNKWFMRQHICKGQSEDREFVVKDGLIDPKFYRIPRDKMESYDDGKVRLALSQDQVKSQFERNSSGYYENKNVTSGRISNTTT